MKTKNKSFQSVLKKCTAFFLACILTLTAVPELFVQADVTLLNEANLTVKKSSKAYDLSSVGLTKNGIIYFLSLDGSPAFCIDLGKGAKTGITYARTNSSTDMYGIIIESIADNYSFANALGADIGLDNILNNDAMYSLVQAVIWGFSSNVSRDNKVKILKIVMADYNISIETPNGTPMWTSEDEFFEEIIDGIESSIKYHQNGTWVHEFERSYYLYNSGYSNYQRMISTASGVRQYPEYDRVSSTQTYSATDSVSISINKTDKDTGKPLSHVSFDVYRDNVRFVSGITTNAQGYAGTSYNTQYTESATSGNYTYCSNYNSLSVPNQQLISNNGYYTSYASAKAAADAEALANAKAKVDALLAQNHTYKVVETQTKTAYYLNPNSTTQSQSYASGDGSGSITFNFTNARQLGTINVTKQDAETNYLVDGAVYGLYAREDIIHPDGSTGTLYRKDALVGTFPATGTNGVATLNNLYLGKYYVKEITSPYGYLLSDESYNIDLNYAGQTVSVTDASTTATDKVQRGSIDITKLDKELAEGKDASIFDANSDGSQGDSTRVGATYGLYAREDIVHADGSTGIVTYNDVEGSIHELKATKGTNFKVKDVEATAGTLLATIKTDANGEFGFSNLYNGKYYVKEIEASEGYLLDETEYDVDLSYTNQNEEIVSKETTVYETVKKQAFELVKVGHTVGTSQNAKPLEGVEFTVKLESDVLRLGWDNAPAYDVIKTAKDGTGTSIELPYGYYRVRETKSADDYNTANDFFVLVEEDNREPQTFTNNIVINEAYSSLLKVVKRDKETSKVVLRKNATYKIKAMSDVTVDGKKFEKGEYIGYWNWNIFDGFYTDTWKTNEDGYIIVNEKLGAGSYQLEEVNAPEYYLVDETPIPFTVSTSNMVEISQDGKTPVLTVEQADVPVKGQITVEKRGEVLVDYDEITSQFIYEERGLAGTKYNIVAKENIMDPSNDGTVLYKKGTVVETLTTGTNGKATSSKLPLGTYEVVEIEATKGMVLSDLKEEVKLEYKDQYTEVVKESVSYVNERQKVKLNLKKLDLDENTELEGAGFTLYANKSILNADGEVIVKKDQAVSVAVSNEKGKIKFDIDLPIDLDSQTTPVDPDAIDQGFGVVVDGNGNIVIGDSNSLFYMKETKRPIGYATLGMTMYLDTTYQGQTIKDFTIAYDLYNEMTRVAITKSNITTGEAVVGAQLSIYPADSEGNPTLGECFATWITEADDLNTKEDESIHLVKGLEPGTYVLREVLGNASEWGYVTADDVLFVVEDTGDVQYVDMKDDYTKVSISKTDITTGEYVVGTELSVIPLDEEGNPLVGETFDTWVTEDDTHLIEYLPIGDYILREKLQGLAWDYGYVTAEDVKFTVEDTGVVQSVEMKDDYTKLEISKIDIVDGTPVIGAQLSIIPVLEDGTLDEGAVFETWITVGDDETTANVDESVHYIERIPVGKYVLREVLSLATDYGYVTANDVEFEIFDTGKIQRVVMEDDFTKVEISKVDTNGDFVEGSTLQIVPLDDEGNALYGESFDTWVTTDEAHSIQKLPVGKHMIIELSAPDGVVKAKPIIIEVEDTAEVQSFTMVDKRVAVTKTDLVNGNVVTGAELEVTDKETGEIVDKWVSSKESHYVSGLEEGKTYILTEVLAPTGFYVAESVEFTVSEDKEDQKVEMKDAPILTDIVITKVDSKTGKAITGKDFKFSLYSDAECKNKIATVNGNTETGIATFEDLRYGTYYVKETGAPLGYKLSGEVVKVVLDDNAKGIGDKYEMSYENTLEPIIKTGDTSAVFGYGVLLLVSLIGCVLLITRRKRVR